MKKVTVFFFLVVVVQLASAIPQQINYQGSLTSPAGTALDTTVAMTFKLYSDSTAGTLLWTETRPGVSVSRGLFSVRLGSITPLTGSVFDSPPVWLGITVGSNSEMTPRSRIVSVGYSYRVGTVDGASGGSITGTTYIVGDLHVGDSNSGNGDGLLVGTDHSITGEKSSITGGADNHISSQYSHIGAGTDNYANGDLSVIGGGASNTTNQYASIGGGTNNFALGVHSTVEIGRAHV